MIYVAVERFTNTISVLTSDVDEADLLDRDTQTIIEINEAEYADRMVDTPTGQMRYIKALRTLPQSFTLSDSGELVHDDSYIEATW